MTANYTIDLLPYVFLYISVRGLHVISDQEVGGKIITVMQQSDYEEKGLADTLVGLKSHQMMLWQLTQLHTKEYSLCNLQL